LGRGRGIDIKRMVDNMRKLNGGNMRNVLLVVLALWSVGFGYTDTVYVDPAAAGANNGVDWTNAYTTLQAGVDAALSKTLLLMRGAETIAATVDFDINDSVDYVGCNSSGVIDGTDYDLNGNGAATYCININAMPYLTIRFLSVHNASTDNIRFTGAASNVLIENCRVYSAGAYGMQGSTTMTNLIVRNCTFYSNTNYATYQLGNGVRIEYSLYYLNGGGHSHTSRSTGVFTGSVFSSNARCDISLTTGTISEISNCVFDGAGTSSDTGISITSTGSIQIITKNRFTNLSMGSSLNNTRAYRGNNHYYGNGVDTVGTGFCVTGKNVDADNNTYNTGSDYGYIDPTNRDFNLKAGAIGRRTPLKVGHY
jgi:hypothetical protein